MIKRPRQAASVSQAGVNASGKLSHGLDLHVAVVHLPLIALRERHGADEAND